MVRLETPEGEVLGTFPNGGTSFLVHREVVRGKMSGGRLVRYDRAPISVPGRGSLPSISNVNGMKVQLIKYTRSTVQGVCRWFEEELMRVWCLGGQSFASLRQFHFNKFCPLIKVDDEEIYMGDYSNNLFSDTVKGMKASMGCVFVPHIPEEATGVPFSERNDWCIHWKAIEMAIHTPRDKRETNLVSMRANCVPERWRNPDTCPKMAVGLIAKIRTCAPPNPTQLTVDCQLVPWPLAQVDEGDIMAILMSLARANVSQIQMTVYVSEDDTEYHRGQFLIMGPEIDPAKKVVSEYRIIQMCDAKQLLFSPFKKEDKNLWASTYYNRCNGPFERTIRNSAGQAISIFSDSVAAAEHNIGLLKKIRGEMKLRLTEDEAQRTKLLTPLNPIPPRVVRPSMLFSFNHV